MGILDNLEAALEAEEAEICHYCNEVAKYTDIAEKDQASYGIVGVCECHAYKGLSS
jgi:hypothetical protein